MTGLNGAFSTWIFRHAVQLVVGVTVAVSIVMGVWYRVDDEVKDHSSRILQVEGKAFLHESSLQRHREELQLLRNYYHELDRKQAVIIEQNKVISERLLEIREEIRGRRQEGTMP